MTPNHLKRLLGREGEIQMKHCIQLESLILAQIERWRHA